MNSNLIALLKLAQGSRGQNQYAEHSNISHSALSAYLLGTRKPSADALFKLANRAYNGVTYEKLMQAAGYYAPNNCLTISPKQQQAFDLLKQIDESNLNTVIGFLEGALRMQEQIKQTNKN